MTSYLLDTHILLWWLSDSKQLSVSARKIMSSPENRVVVSAATAWEIAIKKSLGKLKAPGELEKVLQDGGFELLPIYFQHCEVLEKLPDHHRDPFDRMLIAQAMLENMILITQDEKFKQYDVKML